MKTDRNNLVYRNNYNVLDAGKNFIYILLMPLVFGVLFIVVLTVIAYSSGTEVEILLETPFMNFLNNIFVHLVFIGIFIYYGYKNKINVIYATKLSKKINYVKLILIVLLSFVLIYTMAPIIALINHLFEYISFAPASDLPFELNTVPQLFIAIFGLALLPAVIEELLFRGVILNGLLSKFKPVYAILLSAVMFMLMHGTLQQTIYQLYLGIVLAYVVYVTGNILYAILLHFFNNLIVVINAYIVTQSGLETPVVYVTAMDYIIPIAIFIVGLVLAYILCMALKSKNYNEFMENLKLSSNKFNTKTGTEGNIIKEGDNPSLPNYGKNEVYNGKFNLTSYEKTYLYTSISVGVILWVLNTLFIIFNI